MLKAQNISKIFYTPAKLEILKNISLEILPKQSIAIMGSSGTGKSTLLHILSSLEKPDQGEIFFYDKPLKDLAKLRNENIGFIFQSFFLIEHLSVLQNVLMPAKIARKSTSKISSTMQRAEELLTKVGLYERRHQLAKTLSGGEKQRVCIARALCNNPSVVFADEPTGNLDQETAQSIQQLLFETINAEEKALVVVTHDPHFAQRCDKVYQLKNGELFVI